MKLRHFIAAALAIAAVAALLRGLWLTADPPVRRPVGIVWHDEGAWVHNARNKALVGAWRTDAWNPMFVAPVFTALEYASFRAFGVGTWQARIVPALSGLVAVLCLMAGLRALAGARAALVGGLLLSTNYAFVMWNRAALMESTMTMWIVAAWMAWTIASCSTRSTVVWAYGAMAGVCAVAAWFTKAAAAFFVAALAIEMATLALVTRHGRPAMPRAALRQTIAGGGGLLLAFLLAGVVFVLPHWTDYQFYNWQMSVTRKPDYTLRAFADRASWIPFVQGIFSGMWIELAAAVAAVAAFVPRWTTIRSSERLLVLWILVGIAELVVHDSGNERRYVMFIPALVALASMWLASDAARLPRDFSPARVARIVTCIVIAPLFYVLAGAFLRPFVLGAIESGRLSMPVRSAAAAALAATLVFAWRWRGTMAWLSRPLGGRLSAATVVLIVAWNLGVFADWARHRTTRNRDASVALGRLLPEGALVQGKLANGLALENHIRPLFVGNAFGNYDDRLRRDDARYILTYDLPRIGYESSDGSGLIQGMLDHYPRRRVIAAFDVDETSGPDRAVLIDKFPDSPAHARD